MKKLDEEQVHHLIDLLKLHTEDLYSSPEYRLFSDAQKEESKKYDENLINDLKKFLS